MSRANRGEDWQPNLDQAARRERRPPEDVPLVRSSIAARGRGGFTNRSWYRGGHSQQSIRRPPSPVRRYDDERSRYPPVPTGPRNRPAPLPADRGRPSAPSESMNDPNPSRYIPTYSTRRPSPPRQPRRRSPSPRPAERRQDSSPRQPFPATQASPPKNSFALFKEESVSPEKPPTQPPRHSPPVYRNPSSSGPVVFQPSPVQPQAGPSRVPASTPFSPSQLDDFPMAEVGQELSDDELTLRPTTRPSQPRPSVPSASPTFATAARRSPSTAARVVPPVTFNAPRPTAPTVPSGPRAMQSQPIPAQPQETQNTARQTGSSDMEISSTSPQPQSVPATSVKREIPSPVATRPIQTMEEDLKPALPERSPTPPPIQRRLLPVTYPQDIRSGDVGSQNPDAHYENNLLFSDIYKFLELFFDRFDSSRGAMFDFYAPHAVFSYSINGRMANPDEEDSENGFISHMITNERNLHLRSGELSIQVQSIINKFRLFPATEHDFKSKRSKFVFDAWTVPLLVNSRLADVQVPIVCTVQGEYRELTSTRVDGMRGVMRSFARSFVLLPIDPSRRTTQAVAFSILSDQLHVRNYMPRPTSLVPATHPQPQQTQIEQEIASILPPPTPSASTSAANQANSHPAPPMTSAPAAAPSQNPFRTVVNNMAAARASVSPVLPATRPTAPAPETLPAANLPSTSTLSGATSKNSEPAPASAQSTSVPKAATVIPRANGASSLAILSRAQQPTIASTMRRSSGELSRAPSPALPRRSATPQQPPVPSTSNQPTASTSKQRLEPPAANAAAASEPSKKKRTLSDASIRTIDSAPSENSKKKSKKGKSKEIPVDNAQKHNGESSKKKKSKSKSKQPEPNDGLTKNERKRRKAQLARASQKQQSEQPQAPMRDKQQADSARSETAVALPSLSRELAQEVHMNQNVGQTIEQPDIPPVPSNEAETEALSVLEQKLQSLFMTKKRLEEYLVLDEEVGEPTSDEQSKKDRLRRLKARLDLDEKIEIAEAAVQAKKRILQEKTRNTQPQSATIPSTGNVPLKPAPPHAPADSANRDVASRPQEAQPKAVLQQKSAIKPRTPIASSSKIIPLDDTSEEEDVPAPAARKVPSKKTTHLFSVRESASYDLFSILGPNNVARHILSPPDTKDYFITTKRGDVVKFNSQTKAISSVFDSSLTIRDSSTSCLFPSSNAVLMGYLGQQKQGSQVEQIGVVGISGDLSSRGGYSLKQSPHTSPKPDTLHGVSAMLSLPRGSRGSVDLVTGGQIDRMLYLWDLKVKSSGKLSCADAPIKVDTCHTSTITALAYSADYNLLVSGGLDKKIVTYSAGVGGPVRMRNAGKPACLMAANISSLRFSPAEPHMLLAETMSTQDQMAVFDVRKEASKPDLKFGFDLESNLSRYTNGTFSPDGKFYALGNKNGLKIWDMRNTSAPAIEEKRNSSEILQVCWSKPKKIVLLEKKHISVLNV